MTVVWFFLTMTRVCLQFVIVVFPDHTHLLFITEIGEDYKSYHVSYETVRRWRQSSKDNEMLS